MAVRPTAQKPPYPGIRRSCLPASLPDSTRFHKKYLTKELTFCYRALPGSSMIRMAAPSAVLTIASALKGFPLPFILYHTLHRKNNCNDNDH